MYNLSPHYRPPATLRFQHQTVGLGCCPSWGCSLVAFYVCLFLLLSSYCFPVPCLCLALLAFNFCQCQMPMPLSLSVFIPAPVPVFVVCALFLLAAFLFDQPPVICCLAYDYAYAPPRLCLLPGYLLPATWRAFLCVMCGVHGPRPQPQTSKRISTM